MAQTITKDDLREFAEDIGRRIDGLAAEVKEVKGEWRATNGRVRVLEVGQAVSAQRTTSLEKETFNRRRDDNEDSSSTDIRIPRKWIGLAAGLGTALGAALVKFFGH